MLVWLRNVLALSLADPLASARESAAPCCLTLLITLGEEAGWGLCQETHLRTEFLHMRSQGTLVCLCGFATCWLGRAHAQRAERGRLIPGVGRGVVYMCPGVFIQLNPTRIKSPHRIQPEEMQKSQNNYTASPCPCPGGPDRNMWDSLDLLALGWLRK